MQVLGVAAAVRVFGLVPDHQAMLTFAMEFIKENYKLEVDPLTERLASALHRYCGMEFSLMWVEPNTNAEIEFPSPMDVVILWIDVKDCTLKVSIH